MLAEWDFIRRRCKLEGCHFNLTHESAVRLQCILHKNRVTQHPTQPIKVQSLVAERVILGTSMDKVLDALAAQDSLQHLGLLSMDDTVRPFFSPLPPCRPFLSSPLFWHP